MRIQSGPRSFVVVAIAAAVVALTASSGWSRSKTHRQIVVPEEDRFTPFSVEIKPGESVEWVNNDEDDHTIVSDDVFNTAGYRGIDQLLPGTESNHGQPGRFTLQFTHPGTFVFYCRFH